MINKIILLWYVEQSSSPRVERSVNTFSNSRATGYQEIDEDFMLSTMSSHTGILGPRGSDRGVPRLTNAPNRQYTTYKCTLRVYCIIRPLKLYCLRIERMFIIHYVYTVPCTYPAAVHRFITILYSSGRHRSCVGV